MRSKADETFVIVEILICYPKIGASLHSLFWYLFLTFFFRDVIPVLNAKCGFYKVCELVISVCLSCYTGPYKFFGCTTPLSLNKTNTNNLRQKLKYGKTA